MKAKIRWYRRSGERVNLTSESKSRALRLAVEAKNGKQITKKQWKAMKLITPADCRRGTVKADADGDMWEWITSGNRVTVKPFTQFPYRNDLHRLMNQPASFFKQ